MSLGDRRPSITCGNRVAPLVRLVLDSCGRLVRGQIGKASGGTSRCVETYRLRQPHQVEKPPNYGMV